MKKYRNKRYQNEIIEAEKLQQPARFMTVTDGILSGRTGFYLIKDNSGVRIERPEIFESEYEELK